MANVGLLYVGAVLFVNGLMLLGRVPARSAAILNLFVGALQCVIPTVLLIRAGADAHAILGASGLYLFGFTYLYVGIANLAGLEPEGLGWFSLFVAGVAIVYSGFSFGVQHDPVFGVIWLSWSMLWALFFLLLGLGKQHLNDFTGWCAVLLSQTTCTLPALLALAGVYRPTVEWAVIGAVIGVVLVLISAALGFRRRGGLAAPSYGAAPA